VGKLSVDQALLKARSHVKKGEKEEAQKIYQVILQKFPENKQAQQAFATLNKSIQSATKQAPPQEIIDQIFSLYNQGQLKAVLLMANRLIIKYPDAIVFWNFLGAANKGLGRMVEASKAFKKVTKLNPNYAVAHYNLGIALQDEGSLEKSIMSYKKALTIKPDYVDAYNNMGNVFKDQGKLKEAIAAYNKAVVIKPNYVNAYNNIGNALRDQGKLEEAVDVYKKALAIKPDYTDAYNNMGNALRDQGKLEESIKAYNKALSLKPA